MRVANDASPFSIGSLLPEFLEYQLNAFKSAYSSECAWKAWPLLSRKPDG
jgi:hypothetical protein